MAHEPWFKLYAADWRSDSKVLALPPDARALLLEMWVECHLSGDCSCPAEVDELARAIRWKTEWVSQCVSQCESFFNKRGDRYFSPRMEHEKRKSMAARIGAKKLWSARTSEVRNANRSANCNTKRNAQMSDIQSQIDIHTPASSSSQITGTKKKPVNTPLPDDFTISDGVRKWADLKGHARLEERLEHFKDQALAKCYRYADWDAAFKNAIRDDWAKLNPPAQSNGAENKNGNASSKATTTFLVDTTPAAPNPKMQELIKTWHREAPSGGDHAD
jgi:uncharacterized protein YdaU (DUF1376 family)